MRRTAAWFAGVAAIAVATSSGVGRYAPVFFSVTIVQHVLLGVIAPLLLSRGAPVILVLRALRPARHDAANSAASGAVNKTASEDVNKTASEDADRTASEDVNQTASGDANAPAFGAANELASHGARETAARAENGTVSGEGVAGPREWVVGALRSRAARILTSPGNVVLLWVLGMAGIYFTGVFEATRWSYAVDLAVQAYLLGSGSLLFWWLTGSDPRPGGRRGDGTRAVMAVVAGAAAVVAGLLLAGVVGVVAADWWIGLLRVLPLPWPWGSATAADDQAVGGALLAAVSGVVFLVIAADRLLAASLARRKPRN